MAELDISKSSTTSLASKVSDFSVNQKALDFSNDTDETFWDFEEATRNIGYYKSIPELKKAIDFLAIWTVGKGYECSTYTKVILEHLDGWGEDTFLSILWNLVVMKKVVGDSFAEIIRDEDGTLLNLKPISAERMRIVVGKNGRIKRYVYKSIKGDKNFKRNEILHLSNDRVGDEIHGTSVIDACKWVIDARNEALRDYRVVLHRNVIPVRIIEVDTDDTTKRDLLIRQYEDAIKKGEVLVIPKGTVSIADNTITIQDPTTWISYLENYFYQAVGVPRIIATSEGYSEAGGKVGFLTFEPIYSFEQKLLEADMWNQLGIKITFNRPPSLSGVEQQNEEKNSGQLGIQPNETEASITRTE